MTASTSPGCRFIARRGWHWQLKGDEDLWWEGSSGWADLFERRRGHDGVRAQEAQELPRKLGLCDGQDEDEEARPVRVRRAAPAVEGRHDARPGVRGPHETAGRQELR